VYKVAGIPWLCFSWAALAAASMGCDPPQKNDCPLLVQRVKTIRQTLAVIAVAAPKDGATAPDIQRYVIASADAFDQAATTTNLLSLERPALVEHKNDIATLSTQAATDARKIAEGLGEIGAMRTDLGQLEATAIKKRDAAKTAAKPFLEKCPEKKETCQAVATAVAGLETGLPQGADAGAGAERADALALRFDALQDLVKAATEVPAPIQKPFADEAGDAASAFRALAGALHEVAPVHAKILAAQKETESALRRLNEALNSAAKKCGEELPSPTAPRSAPE